MKTDTKSQKYLAVSKAIMDVMDQQGLDKLTHSLISRISGISRAWIYEYIGKEQEDLIHVASDTLGQHFSKAGIKTDISNANELLEHLAESQERALEIILEEPIFIRIYFRFKGTDNAVGKSVEKYEKYWLTCMAENIQKSMGFDLGKSQMLAQTLLVLRLGFYHRIATAKSKEAELAMAKESLKTVYRKFSQEK